MENDMTPLPEKTPDSSNTKVVIGILWIVSLVITGGIGFAFGHGSKPIEKNTEKNVLSALQQAGEALSPTPGTDPTPAIVNNNVCSKSGFAQKWEYLASYEVKENDSLQSIVASELNDSSRINEVMQINGIGPLVVGSTLYLPPASITKSTGKIKQVSGRLVIKDTTSWQLSFNGDKDGQRIIIPSFWFEEIADKDSYKVGECITVLLDDGFKVFSVSRQ